MRAGRGRERRSPKAEDEEQIGEGKESNTGESGGKEEEGGRRGAGKEKRNNRMKTSRKRESRRN